MINKRKITYNRYKIRPSANLFIKYEKLTEIIKIEIDKIESEKVFNYSKNCTNLNSLYKKIKLLNSYTLNNVLINDNETPIYDDKQISEAFANLFQSVYSKCDPFELNLNENVISENFIISMNDTLEMINKFNKKCDSGPSVIPNQILNKCLNGIYTFFSIKFFRIKNYQKV